MGEGSYIILFSPSDVTEFHRIDDVAITTEIQIFSDVLIFCNYVCIDIYVEIYKK